MGGSDIPSGRGLDLKVEDVFVGKWVVIWALRAFAKCCAEKRTMEIWDELKSRWKPNQREQEHISGVLWKALRASGSDI